MDLCCSTATEVVDIDRSSLNHTGTPKREIPAATAVERHVVTYSTVNWIKEIVAFATFTWRPGEVVVVLLYNIHSTMRGIQVNQPTHIQYMYNCVLTGK